jgi:RNA-directed DNA polymerase
MIFRESCFYRTFQIPKKRGGERQIDAPYPSLKMVQNWIYNEILKKFRSHFAVNSFVAQKSIINNAKIHVNQPNILKIDIQDFFPSINFSTVFYLFYNFGYTRKVSFYLAKLCTLNDSIPQGAPTSPCISNLIFRDIDWQLYKLAKKSNLKYSRYADDICFSGIISKELKINIIRSIKKILIKRGFKVNNTKTAFLHKNQRQIVTGIIVNEKLSVKKEYERKIRQELYYIQKYGIKSHLGFIGEKRNNYLKHLLGKIEFICQVSKRDRYLSYKKLIKNMIDEDD